VGDDRFPGKYPDDLMMRFRRVGARAFLRLNHRRFRQMSIFGDCGAFSYAHLPQPPYTPAEMLDFYADGQFTHGCSVDHIIFDFDESARALKGGTDDARSRFDVTLENAAKFLKLSRAMGRGFIPLGVVQGWSPASMAHAALRLERMGYGYLAVGGMVPLNARQIHLCLDAIRQRLSSSRTKLHLLGFAKAEQIHEFKRHRVTSFDTTSPLRRAFKDARANYYHLTTDGGLEYFTAIRVPHATENTKLKRRAKASGSPQEQLQQMERMALEMLRRYSKRRASIERTIDAVVRYSQELLDATTKPGAANGAKEAMAAAVRRTLECRPWESCRCRVCREAGIEALIFRGSNRNKRRGFHNIAVYNEYIKRRVQ
jgi:hypothetical protein